MMVPKPHFLLFCDGQSPRASSSKEAAIAGANAASVRGRWRFVLEDLDAGTRLEACDAELVQAPERAALLAVVRGLEALEQPSRVTLVTTSRYVSRGLQFGLSEWRESDYCWEHFGSVQPIRNADLWRRIDHASQFHQINCQWITGQSSDDAEEMTQLKSEPIISTSTSAALQSENRPVRGRQGEVAATLQVHDGRDHAPGPSDNHWLSIWGQFALRFFGSSVRSLRLPNLLSSYKSVDQMGWTRKQIARLTWPFKSARSSRLAV